jgi:hypothetical protein
MKRFIVVLSVLVAALFTTAPLASAGEVSGSLTISDSTPGYGQKVSFSTVIDGKIKRTSKLEISVFCQNPDGSVALQGAVLPGQEFTLYGSGRVVECEAHLRVVEMVKSGVQVLGGLNFSFSEQP